MGEKTQRGFKGFLASFSSFKITAILEFSCVCNRSLNFGSYSIFSSKCFLIKVTFVFDKAYIFMGCVDVFLLKFNFFSFWLSLTSFQG